MSDRNTNCIKHQESWMERHVPETFLLVISVATVVSAIFLSNIYIGFAIGLIISLWLLFRCLAKEVYFTTVHRIRKENGYEG